MRSVGGPTGGGSGVAYFSMEIALDDSLPTYSGGLGVLAGDHLRSAADLGLPLVGVTLLYRHGYFDQEIDPEGSQHERPVEWSPSEVLTPHPQRVTVVVSGRAVEVAAWSRVIHGVSDGQVAVYFLDTDLNSNHPDDRRICDLLYGGDLADRLRQEAVLGLAGPALLAQLGHPGLEVFHMNEGHSSLLAVALHRRDAGGGDGAALEHPGPGRSSGRRLVFTTHTPVPAGHDRFDESLVAEVLGADTLATLRQLGGLQEGELNMSRLGVAVADFVNAVSLRHRQVSQAMFPEADVQAVTNGVHVATWVVPSVARLLDGHAPAWRRDNAALRDAGTLALGEIDRAHREAKRSMLTEVARRTGRQLDSEVMTIGVARRATSYKRNDLLLGDPERLVTMAERVGPLQVVYSGKAHPRDEAGKMLIRRVVAAADALGDVIPVVYLAGYSMGLGRLLCGGVDLWLNTPLAPHEASGTSGMKAALNGVPSLSVLDGWWVEGHVEGVTGWAIGDGEPGRNDAEDAADLYDTLEQTILPLFYHDPAGYLAVRRRAMSLNGSYFTTERMVRQYAERAYWPQGSLTHGDGPT